MSSKGREWVTSVLTAAGTAWSSDALAGFLLSLPRAGWVWDEAERLGPEVERVYWAGLAPFGLADAKECERAAQKLLAHGRPLAALELLGLYAGSAGSTLDPELIATALEAALDSPGDDRPATGAFDYNVERLLDAITKSGAIDEVRLAHLEWGWMPLFRYGRRVPEVLHHELRRNPQFFVELVSTVYRGENEEPHHTDEQERQRAAVAHDLLDNWRTPPGFSPDGVAEGTAFRSWVDEARRLLGERERRRIGDLCIGHLVSGVPTGTDSTWPHEAVRDMLEELGSDALEQGIATGVYNSRGVFSKDLDEGGASERRIAERYDAHAQAVASRWPRTAALLRSIASTYRHDAKREDLDADAMQDG